MGSQGPFIDFEVFHNTINGALRSGEPFHNGVDPSTKSALWNVPIATAHDLDEAVAAAKKAFGPWSKLTPKVRQGYLSQLSAALLDAEVEMGNLLSRECGKPSKFARFEVHHAIRTLNFYAKCTLPEEEVVQDDENLLLTTRHVPIGVVGAICPWNFPLMLAIGKIAAALATGNTVIAKPSPFTPYTTLKFAEISQRILPVGVLQALNGDNGLGPLMCAHPGIGKISFTGSSATGKKVMETASKTLKNVSLELGGNNGTIVCPDIDIEMVAPQIAMAAFFNTGQVCVATKRIYVHESIYQEFLVALVKAVKSWKVGPATEDGTMMGPVQNAMQYGIVKAFFEDSQRNGHKFALGGTVERRDGFFIDPGIVDCPPDDSMIVTGEPFGPIVPVLSWSDEAEVIRRVNDTMTGLGGAVWSADINRANRIARQIEAGSIWINSSEQPLPEAYFAGHKESGVGGEGGTQGLLAYCNAQTTYFYKQKVGKN